MIQDVLPITRPPPHASNELDQLGVEAMDSTLVSGLLTRLDDRGIDFLTRFVDALLDAAGVDATIRHQLLEGESGDLAAHRIEARDNHGVGRVVDDDVDAGGEL